MLIKARHGDRVFMPARQLRNDRHRDEAFERHRELMPAGRCGFDQPRGDLLPDLS